MFGLGVTELLILLVLATMGLGVPIVVALLVWRAAADRNHNAAPTYSQLIEENQRLREELASRDSGANR